MSNKYKDLPPHIKDIIIKMETMAKVLPWLTKFLQQDGFEFRGMSVYPSDRGGYTTLLKIYREDGQPLRSFSNGPTPLESLLASENAILGDRFYLDKKAPEYTPED